MTIKKVNSWEEVRSQHDAIRWADQTGKALVKHEAGKYYSISTEKGTVHLYDNCRAEPKCAREQIRFWFFCLGLPVAAILAAIFFGN